MLESVKMDRGKLSDIVAANRRKHLIAYEEAMTEYALRYRERLAELLRLADQGKFEDVKLRQPRSHETDYDLALSMLDHSVDQDITLSDHTYRQLVLDQWQWRHEFEETNALYGKLK